MQKVKCINSHWIIWPKVKGVDIKTLEHVTVGEEYEVEEKISKMGKEYYKLKGIDNHLFDVRGFR